MSAGFDDEVSEADISEADLLAIGERLQVVRDRIVAAGGDLGRVKIVAVTKGFGPQVVKAAQRLGLYDMGESYAQELLQKAAQVELSARETENDSLLPMWHFIGRLQSNKVRLVAPLVSMWQSIDRESVIDEVARRVPGAKVLIEVNVSGETSKGGCPPRDALALVDRARESGLDVVGLMAIGARGSDEVVHSGFRLLANLADDGGLVERSMGMSGDYEVAVQEGATMVRLGQVLFGPRTGPRNEHQEMRH